MACHKTLENGACDSRVTRCHASCHTLSRPCHRPSRSFTFPTVSHTGGYTYPRVTEGQPGGTMKADIIYLRRRVECWLGYHRWGTIHDPDFILYCLTCGTVADD